MHRLNKLIAKNILPSLDQLKVTLGAGIGLIAAHQPSPLLLTHGVGAAICQQVDVNIFSTQVEHVVLGFS